MAKEFSRTVRVADQIQRSLALLIQTEVSDPRVGLVNINDIEVTRDYSLARVFVTFVDRENEDDCEKALAALNNAAGFLRALLAKSLNSRTTPKLLFVYDKTTANGTKLASLINTALKADRDHHETRD